MTDTAKALRAKLCIETECTYDDDCSCLEDIRAALAAAQAGTPTYEELHSRSPEAYKQGVAAGAKEIERLQAEIERMLKALCEAGDEILRQRRAGAEWQEKYKLATAQTGAPTYEELHSRSPEAYAQGFAVGIEKAAQLVDGVAATPEREHFAHLAAAIRALRPAETAETTEAEPEPDGPTKANIRGAEMLKRLYPVPQPAGPSEEDLARMAEAIQKSIEHGCDITPPESMVAARAAHMALRAKEPAGPSEAEILSIFHNKIRLVTKPGVDETCDECGEPLVWMVKPGTLEDAAKAVLALLQRGKE